MSGMRVAGSKKMMLSVISEGGFVKKRNLDRKDMDEESRTTSDSMAQNDLNMEVRNIRTSMWTVPQSNPPLSPILSFIPNFASFTHPFPPCFQSPGFFSRNSPLLYLPPSSHMLHSFHPFSVSPSLSPLIIT